MFSDDFLIFFKKTNFFHQKMIKYHLKKHSKNQLNVTITKVEFSVTKVKRL